MLWITIMKFTSLFKLPLYRLLHLSHGQKLCVKVILPTPSLVRLSVFFQTVIADISVIATKNKLSFVKIGDRYFGRTDVSCHLQTSSIWDFLLMCTHPVARDNNMALTYKMWGKCQNHLFLNLKSPRSYEKEVKLKTFSTQY